MPPNQGPPPSDFTIVPTSRLDDEQGDDGARLRCAVLGCGMMGQEHISYILGYHESLRIDFLCDPHGPSIDKSLKIISAASSKANKDHLPQILSSEEELYARVREVDLLVIATPNYLHTESLLKWGKEDICILLEKPVAVSQDQHDRLQAFCESGLLKARVWVAMEYRYIPAIARLIELLPTIGQVKQLSIRENRYPFLHKVGNWNRDANKTGDTLVEKCCHFFDLMRLISSQEVELNQVRALAQRGLNYEDEDNEQPVPIIDSAYVVMPFREKNNHTDHDDTTKRRHVRRAMGCLELCMYAEGSRHQEEIVVTGTKGRLEAYLPENKVYRFERPNHELWSDRSVPPPPSSIRQTVYDCSDVKDVHGIDTEIPTHGGYHYCSTSIEWHKMLGAIRTYHATGIWKPEVSLEDGLRAVEIGLHATRAVLQQEEEEEEA